LPTRGHGILGENLLEHFDLLIDYAHGIVCLADTKQMQQKVKVYRTSEDFSSCSGLVQPLVLELDSGINSPLLVDAGKLRTAANTTGKSAP
jgi:hypothetical protein